MLIIQVLRKFYDYALPVRFHRNTQDSPSLRSSGKLSPVIGSLLLDDCNTPCINLNKRHITQNRYYYGTDKR